jgi:hypothetical protein
MMDGERIETAINDPGDLRIRPVTAGTISRSSSLCATPETGLPPVINALGG